MGLKFLPSKADYYLNNNDEFNISNMNFKIIATPGHTNGSICYLLNDKYLFTGDTLFYHSFGRTDFPTGDYNELMKSLEFLSNLNYDYIVLPGHGESTSIFDEKEFIKNVRD